MAQVTLTFRAQRETTNTILYEEETSSPDVKPVIGRLYVQKRLLEKWGFPDTLSVHIESVS